MHEKGDRTLYTARMNRRSRSLFVAIVAGALALALSGCGNKGPLVLADDVPADATVTETPAPAPPAEPAATPPAAEDPAAKPPR